MYATFLTRLKRFDVTCEESPDRHMTEQCLLLRELYSDAFFALEREMCLVEEERL